MDLHKIQNQDIQDFFQQSHINNLDIPIIHQYQESYLSDENFLFQNRTHHIIDKFQVNIEKTGFDQREDSQSENAESEHIFLEYHHEFQDILGKIHNIQESFQKIIKPPVIQTQQTQQKQIIKEQEIIDINISQPQLQSIIRYLVQNSSLNGNLLYDSMTNHYPKFSKLPIVKILIQKFTKLKKTKQQLIKYCMRKAFKFILQLPKNRHLLNNGQKNEKYSFSKCKNKYLKKISEQKSMNSRFLQQIFSQKDFKKDYIVFLQKFQFIMAQDNQKKIKYLAWLLTNQKYGKMKSVQMVRRLPWTNAILERVIKISKQLLCSAQQHKE